MEKLTVDQWKALTSAAPTNVTNILVAAMTLDIINDESMMSDPGSSGLKYVEDVVLQQSFCDALHMKQADESLKSLTKMIHQENRGEIDDSRLDPGENQEGVERHQHSSNGRC